MNRPKVLVVDDDPAICAVIAHILSDAGVATVCAQSDRQAYLALDSDGPFKALVADLNLGHGTTGFDVARAARAKLPSLRVLYITGEASDASFRTFGVEGSRFLFKPFSASELLGALGLGGGAGSGSNADSGASAS